MSDKKTVIGDKMIESQLNEKSKMLGISLNELIERYIKRGLYSDDYYIQPQLSKRKLMKFLKGIRKEIRKRRFLSRNYNFM